MQYMIVILNDGTEKLRISSITDLFKCLKIVGEKTRSLQFLNPRTTKLFLSTFAPKGVASTPLDFGLPDRIFW